MVINDQVAGPSSDSVFSATSTLREDAASLSATGHGSDVEPASSTSTTVAPARDGDSTLLPPRQQPARETASRGGVTGLRARVAAAMRLPRGPGTARNSDAVVQNMELLEQTRRELERMHYLSSLAGPDPSRELSELDAEIRILKLRQDEFMANRAAPRRSTAGIFKAACSTDLLFLMDTTGSMEGYIEAAKKQVKNIMADIRRTFFNEADVRMAVVAYRDHCDKPNIQHIDFTTDAAEVRRFIDGLRATGGADLPEDVLGGINQALECDWQNQTRCIIHIADAPPHGRTMHDLSKGWDSYPEPGSEPHKLMYSPLIVKMADLKINYAMMRINESTDKMAFNFLQAYASAASADCKLHQVNKYFKQATDLTKELKSSSSTGKGSKRSATAQLQFQEVELGTSYSALQHLVVKYVTTSASRTATYNPSSSGRSSKGSRARKKAAMLDLEAITEDDNIAEEDEDPKFDTEVPQWDNADWFDTALRVEAFFTDVGLHAGSSTLDDMMADDSNIKLTTTDLTIQKRRLPFAEGAMRTASYARTAASTNRLVVKSFKKQGKDLAHLAEEMRCQALCKAFALEFNAMAGEAHSLDFVSSICLKPHSGSAKPKKHLTLSSDDDDNDGDGECMSLEPYMPGTYTKYNSNGGWVNDALPASDPLNEAAQAFSHFTFERSRGRLLISDVQGVGPALTDPAVHTRDPDRFKLTDANLGEAGFKFFFATHRCNALCRRLRLRSTAGTLLAGCGDFRERWPGRRDLDGRVACCSNKLCARILRVAGAGRADEFPGYHWCGDCWPQLVASKARVVCEAGLGGQGGEEEEEEEEAKHEFEVSRFFYESQGQIVPRVCPEHRKVPAQRARQRSGTEGKGSSFGLRSLFCMLR